MSSKGNSGNLNKKLYHNPETKVSIFLNENDEIPQGYILGRLPDNYKHVKLNHCNSNNPNYGKTVYHDTDGKEYNLFPNDETILSKNLIKGRSPLVIKKLSEKVKLSKEKNSTKIYKLIDTNNFTHEFKTITALSEYIKTLNMNFHLNILKLSYMGIITLELLKTKFKKSKNLIPLIGYQFEIIEIGKI